MAQTSITITLYYDDDDFPDSSSLDGAVARVSVVDDETAALVIGSEPTDRTLDFGDAEYSIPINDPDYTPGEPKTPPHP